MKTDKELKALAQPIVEIYQNIEHDLLLKIASFFVANENVTIRNSLDWYFKKLEEMGSLNKEVIKIISKYSNVSEKEIKKLLKEAGYGSISKERIDFLNDKGAINIAYSTLLQAKTINYTINNSFIDTKEIFKMINTKAIESTKKTYMNALNQARLEIGTGLYDYNTAITRAIEKMVDDGIKGATYKRKDGTIYQMTLESVVRRDMLTAIYQTHNKGAEQITKELGAKHVEVSSHLGARLGDGKVPFSNHYSWQGKIYKLDGSDDEYENFYEVTGYGDILGLGGVNCRHKYRPFFIGVDKPREEHFDYEENKRQVELEKQQRAKERYIRKYRTKQDIFKQLGDEENYKKWKKKEKEFMPEYWKFLDDNNLRRDYARERVVKREYKQEQYKVVTQKWLDEAIPNSHKVKDRKYFEHDDIKYEIDNKNVVIDYSKHEYEVAEWLESTFGGEIYMIPRVNKPDGISTPDYLFRGEYWDLKEIKSSGKRAIDNRLNGTRKQTNNYILDITDNNLSNAEIIEQIKRVYQSNNRKWIDKIILKREEQLIKIFERKKD